MLHAFAGVAMCGVQRHKMMLHEKERYDFKEKKKET